MNSNLVSLMTSRRWRWATLLVVIVMALFVWLGVWQLDRLDQRRAQNARLAAVLAEDPIQLPEGLAMERAQTVLENQLVSVSGSYDFENQKQLILQTWGGRNGVNLITPLVLADGKTAVLIDRGWVPDAEAEAETIEKYNQPLFDEITGYVALSQPLPRTANTTLLSQNEQIYRIDIPTLEQTLPYDLYPFYIVLAPEPDDLESFPYHRARDVDLSEGPHLSYAIQWFLFAFVLAVMYPTFIKRRSK